LSFFRPVLAAVVIVLIAPFALNAKPDTSDQDQSSPEIAGCYQLSLGHWWPWGFGDEAKYVTPPSRISLLNERGTNGFEEQGFLIRAMHPDLTDHKWYSWWRVDPRGVYLTWTTGFTGVFIDLHRQGNELRGWAHPFFDTLRLVKHVARVKMARIPCS
jgi:hypothetical protein